MLSCMSCRTTGPPTENENALLTIELTAPINATVNYRRARSNFNMEINLEIRPEVK